MAPDPNPATERIAYLDAATLRQEIDAGRLTSRQVVEALLARIAAIDAPGTPVELRSIIATNPAAVDEADERDREERRGPLHGIPVLLKDNIEAVGHPASAGSTALVGRPPTCDAPLVGRLREAGAVILGATNLSEWANIRSLRSTSGWSAVGGLTANPWALDRSAGGSSSGSGAAVAAGLAPIAIGTETDGSITCPAALNGVIGIKPAVGAVPTGGVVPISASQDSPGPLARTPRDAAVALEALTGEALGPVAVGSLRIGAVATWRTGHPATDACFEAAAAWLRTAPVEAAVPGAQEAADELTVLLCELADDLGAYLHGRAGQGPRNMAELVAHNRSDAHELEHFGQELFEQALTLGGRSAPAYAEARERNVAWAVTTCLEPALDGLDVLVAPSYPPAWKSDLLLGSHPGLGSPVTMPAAIAGWPIASVPTGLVGGLPVAMAVVGRPGSEAALLSVCQAVHERVGVLRPAWRPPSRG